MSGGGTPKDNSVELEQMKEDAAARAEQKALATAGVANKHWWSQRNAAINNATNSIKQYFLDHGVDPTPYMTSINQMVKDKADTLSTPEGLTPGTPIGTTFNNLGESLYTNAQTNERLKAHTQLSQGEGAPFPTGYDYTRVPDTLDDPDLTTINAEQMKTAVDFINNMVARGTITGTGRDAAMAELNRQSPGVMGRLTVQGNQALEGERTAIRDIGGRASAAADALPVGQTFNPKVWGDQLDAQFNSFLSGLGNDIRGRLGNANLYDTSGLATIAGAAQGPGPGVSPTTAPFGPTSDDEENKKNQIANRTGSSSTGLFDSHF